MSASLVFQWSMFSTHGDVDEEGFPLPAFDLYPFKARLLIYTGSPRDWPSLTSKEIIEKIINVERLEAKVLYLYFPERWLSVKETRDFMSTLSKHDYLTHVSIVTCSLVIPTDFFAQQIRVWGPN